jgi:hypothetical protein
MQGILLCKQAKHNGAVKVRGEAPIDACNQGKYDCNSIIVVLFKRLPITIMLT